MDVFIQYEPLSAGFQAIEDAGLKITGRECRSRRRDRRAGIGGIQTIERYHSVLLENGQRRISPSLSPC